HVLPFPSSPSSPSPCLFGSDYTASLPGLEYTGNGTQEQPGMGKQLPELTLGDEDAFLVLHGADTWGTST
ncbi:hypothetical protein RJZ56_003612, partial [Blastomyces dermatitidis]